MKHDLVTLVVILNDTATFKVLFIVSLSCAWNITTVEINSGDHKVKSAKCLFRPTSGGLGFGLAFVYITACKSEPFAIMQ